MAQTPGRQYTQVRRRRNAPRCTSLDQCPFPLRPLLWLTRTRRRPERASLDHHPRLPDRRRCIRKCGADRERAAGPAV